jgi:hypothetical protein
MHAARPVPDFVLICATGMPSDSLFERKQFFARASLDFQGIWVYPSDAFRARASVCCSPAGSSSG